MKDALPARGLSASHTHHARLKFPRLRHLHLPLAPVIPSRVPRGHVGRMSPLHVGTVLGSSVAPDGGAHVIGSKPRHVRRPLRSTACCTHYQASSEAVVFRAFDMRRDIWARRSVSSCPRSFSSAGLSCALLDATDGAGAMVTDASRSSGSGGKVSCGGAISSSTFTV